MKLNVVLSGGESRSYEVMCESGLHRRLDRIIKDLSRGRRVFCVWDRFVHGLWGHRCLTATESIVWDASEQNKKLSAVEELARELVRRGADRHSLLVAVGGGVTGDVVGFLASIYMRGIPVVQIPTTLVAQVDSSVGGKTGVDLPEGKNLLGTFHQPLWVGIDPDFLQTLSEENFREGMAEVIKTAWIGDADLVRFLLDNSDDILRRRADVMAHVVFRCVEIKAGIVMEDEKEGGVRKVLNLGHTFGHAVERISNYTINHGHAVAMGLICAGILGRQLGYLDREHLNMLKDLLSAYGLPTGLPSEYSPDKMMSVFQADKKKVGNSLVFVIPGPPGKVIWKTIEDKKLIDEVIRLAQKIGKIYLT
ncbi:3-dehydroquinate synthase [Thermodesulforhabdus norvegica]|uniref:3-dehydroquinate synthase n=1 Tax=Thermodesulforhabdus norvegica TaxID=39841 RepID=A0A1I4QZS9_9BACT|nr:3-dehydroquinate synthase [Thermodesulforhabdus norvegica]SFM45582.1 3-dehydroquinate synthase [Thermodesulforhabdus norvegica]